MLNRKFRSLVVGVALSLAAGCGSPSTLDLCHTDCDQDKKCGRASECETAQCHTDCNNNAGLAMQSDQNLALSCTNPGDIRKQQADCYGDSDACNSLALTSCLVTAQSRCIKK